MEKHRSIPHISYKDKHHLETNVCTIANPRQPNSSALFIQLRFAKIYGTLERKWPWKNIIYFERYHFFRWQRCLTSYIYVPHTHGQATSTPRSYMLPFQEETSWRF